MKEYEVIEPKIEEQFQKIEEDLVDTSKFHVITPDELIAILGITIKKDETNKLITFLAQLSAYTEDSQLNESFNAPSASGKSFIPTEIAKLFPQEDVIEVGYCSPTAFFHDVGKFDEAKKGYVVDLSRKILIFLDQPHTQLLQHLRPMLSHDKKEIQIKITDKSQAKGLKTKNVYLRGFPAVTFCTAGLKLDEQEATRFILLSPEINQEKIRAAIYEKIKKESNNASYSSQLESNPERGLLIKRIKAIRQAKISQIRIKKPEVIEQKFFAKAKTLKPRHQRDIARIINLVKIFALLNLWFRDRDGETLIANGDDINYAFAVWYSISESQELNIPPYVYDLYRDVVVAAFKELNNGNIGKSDLGLTRQQILNKHHTVYGRYLPGWLLKEQIIPVLESSGLVYQEADPLDRRTKLIYPTSQLSISGEEKNKESDGGVNTTEEDEQDDFLNSLRV